MISRRQDDWLDDGRGDVKGLILAKWLVVVGYSIVLAIYYLLVVL